MEKEEASGENVLETYGIDLTQEVLSLDPIVGRDEEIKQLITLLERRNVILVGDPGVGKTAVVDGLGQKIANATVPVSLRDCRIISLQMDSFLGGTNLRGIFEERISKLVEELKQSEGRVILFVDEIHMLVGAGRGSRSDIDAANLLKPVLSRGDIRCIGATTFEEYAQYIKADEAFARRFFVINVYEPSRDNCINLLKKLVPIYEEKENVNIDPKAASAAVDLSVRYMPAKRLPDKAIQVLLVACTMAVKSTELEEMSETKNDQVPNDAKETRTEDSENRPTSTLGGDKLDKAASLHQKPETSEAKKHTKLSQLLELQKEDEQAGESQNKAKKEKISFSEKSGVSKKFLNLRWRKKPDGNEDNNVEITQSTSQKERDPPKTSGQPGCSSDSHQQDVKSGFSKKFLKLRWRKKPDGNADNNVEIETSPTTQLNEVQPGTEEPDPPSDVTLAHIEMAISILTGLAIHLGVREKQELKNLEQRIGERVVGQEHVIKPIVTSILRYRAGFSDPTKPIGSFLLIGGPGVGKTELAKALALELFHDEKCLITINMAEYYEENSISRLLGAPGLVGWLTEEVFRRPASVLMFEEVQEAHMIVLNALKRMVNSAMLRDGLGKQVNFSNTLVLMSSSSCLYKKKGSTTENTRNNISEEFKRKFTNKLFAELDTLVFDELSEEHLEIILRRKFLEISRMLEVKGLVLEVTPPVVKDSCNRFCNKGVRGIEGWLNEDVTMKLTDIILREDSSSFSKICIDVKEEELVYILE